MSKKIRYGMLGGSLKAFIGEVHRKAINFDTRAEFVAGCFSSDDALNIETGNAYNLTKERVYKNYKEMTEQESKRDDKIDFVSITTPNYLHYEMAKYFLLKDINVVCEKPLCCTIEEAKELEKISKERNLLFAVTYTYTGYTMSKVMKEMIASGKIGEIASVNAEYAQDWLINELSNNESKNNNLSIWRKDPKYSGIANCVGDIGTHIENYVHYVTGLKIKRLLATTNSYSNKLDLNANIIVEYENGVNGAYWCSQIAAGRSNGLIVRIYGSLGSLEWEQQNPDYLRYTEKGKAPSILYRGDSYISEKSASYSRVPVGHPEGLYVAFANIYKDFITALISKKNGETNFEIGFPTVTDGLNGIKFVHAVIDSAKDGSVWKEL